MKQTVLILGSSGRFGRNAVQAFETAGWEVRRFNRKTDSLMQSALGCDVIVVGWNPDYNDWARDVERYTLEVIKAARASGSTVIVPGNVYNFGPAAPQKNDETTPQNARNPLGKIRVNMETSYRSSGIQTIILRAGDFLDTQKSDNWFHLVMVAKLAKGVFVFPGRTDIPRAYAYLPDLTRAAAMLADKRTSLGLFEDIPFPGYTLTGEEIFAQVQKVWARPLKLKRMNWLPIRLAAVVWKMGRYLMEIQYLWDKPHYLDGAKFDRLLPDFVPTPVDEAIRLATLGDVDPDQSMVRSGAPVGSDQNKQRVRG